MTEPNAAHECGAVITRLMWHPYMALQPRTTHVAPPPTARTESPKRAGMCAPASVRERYRRTAAR
eukprot:2213946-Prymnesium_polylepis.1